MQSLKAPSVLGLLFRPCTASPIVAASLRAQTRWAHSSNAPQPPADPPKVPPKTPFVPDVETFLTLIGRSLKQHASKIPTWEALFTLKSEQLKELGIEPARSRRYLKNWTNRFRQGKFGPGGDLLYVQDGVAHLRIMETDKSELLTLRHVVNVPFGKKVEDMARDQLARPRGFKVVGNRHIAGPFALPMRGGGARIAVTEGMWEDKRGHKIDGGERRRAEVRFKKRIAERKAARGQ